MGDGAFLITCSADPSRLDSYSNGKYHGLRLLCIPLLVSGVVGIALIIAGELS